MGRGYWGWSPRARGNWLASDQLTSEEVSGEAVYVGPCRCGFGPHAYYRTKEGKLFHASALRTEPSVLAEAKGTELQQLRRDKEMLEERIRVLESEIAETKAMAAKKKG